MQVASRRFRVDLFAMISVVGADSSASPPMLGVVVKPFCNHRLTIQVREVLLEDCVKKLQSGRHPLPIQSVRSSWIKPPRILQTTPTG